jgi:hypothetical protein
MTDKKAAIALLTVLFAGQNVRAEELYIRETTHGIKVIKAKPSYSEQYEDSILAKVKDPEARQKIGVVFGALHYACLGLSFKHPTKNAEQIRDDILKETHIDLTTDWTKYETAK